MSEVHALAERWHEQFGEPMRACLERAALGVEIRRLANAKGSVIVVPGGAPSELVDLAHLVGSPVSIGRELRGSGVLRVDAAGPVSLVLALRIMGDDRVRVFCGAAGARGSFAWPAVLDDAGTRSLGSGGTLETVLRSLRDDRAEIVVCECCRAANARWDDRAIHVPRSIADDIRSKLDHLPEP